MLELRHFRYALAVADEGHMTRAAERLGIQQPPLSQQIKALETLVGTALFRRHPKGVELTDAGKAFIERARQVVADAEAAMEAARRAGRGETGALAIGFTTSATFHPLVSSVFRSMRLATPDLAMRLQEGSTTELATGLASERLDAAFIRAAANLDPRLTAELMNEEEMVLALPDDHVLGRTAPGTRIAFADVADDTFILYRRPTSQVLYDRIISACQTAGFSPRIAQETPMMISTLSLVAAGLGVTIIPESMARLETSGVTYRRFHKDAGLFAQLFLAFRRAEVNGALKRFIDESRRQARRLSGGDGQPLR
ncbi:LysR family transcriptional regulator [Rhizobium oryzicola]|uniref:LysR family transcriptional regulator n=1 Tax=Rhizobium oryzicola TaxID=1232668 RepID=A0ABT8SQY0_9HYPH|nr:LysR family transcriptional regulator [Rhizobium oryzicola]MDO1580771.1 LysR family transcriptional regulator [Rhizobium oryzicola]